MSPFRRNGWSPPGGLGMLENILEVPHALRTDLVEIPFRDEVVEMDEAAQDSPRPLAEDQLPAGTLEGQQIACSP